MDSAQSANYINGWTRLLQGLPQRSLSNNHESHLAKGAMMQFLIVNERSYPLSSFYANDCVTAHQLKFRKRDYMTFSTHKEAEDYLVYVQERCKQKAEAHRLRIAGAK